MEVLLALMYYFKEFVNLNIFGSKASALQGNLDILYFLSLFLLIKILLKKKNKKYIKQTLVWIIPLIVLVIVQCILIKDINKLKMIVSLLKIYFCILLFVYIKNCKYKKVFNIVICISVIFIISIVPALLFKSSFLWRHNDFINVYNTDRLQLFYTEPSELGFHVSIIIIFLLNFIINKKKNKVHYIILLIGNAFILYLAHPFGSIACLALTLYCMFNVYLLKNKSIKSIVVYSLVNICIIIALIGFFNSSSSIYLRLQDTLTGNDMSNNYRVGVSNKVLINSLINSKGLGIGLGNLNTDKFRLEYMQYGLVDVLANSFPYFFIECGVTAIVYIIILIGYLLNKSNLKNSCLFVGLFVFIVSYQIFGGHFTNPTNWIIYGILGNKVMLNKLERGNIND